MEKILLISLLFISLAFGASNKNNFLSLTSQQPITNTDLANQIFDKINEYRSNVGHMKNLEKLQTLEDTARVQVQYILSNIKSFGSFNEFSIRTEGFKLFGEIVAKIFDQTDDPAQASNFATYKQHIQRNYGIKFY